MGIYQLTIKLPPGTEDECFWKRTVEVPEDFSPFDLHFYIQEIIEFDDDHIFAFYIGRHKSGAILGRNNNNL